MPSLCSHCGTKLDPDCSDCPKCGSETIRTSSQPLFESASAAPPEQSADVLLHAPLFSYTEDLSGIGGWLILIALGLVLSPFYVLAFVIKIGGLLGNARLESYLQTHPMFRALLLFEIVTNAVFFLLLLALNFLFFTKKRSFPNFMAMYLGFQFIVVVADLFAAHALVRSVPISQNGLLSLLRSTIGVFIWIPYLMVSQRVKATFVR